MDLGNNKISSLGDMPSMLRGLHNLRTLNLSNNELKAFPPKLGHLTQLTGMDLRGNPQRSLRHQVRKKGVCVGRGRGCGEGNYQWR